jgi:RNA polymerase sigma factor (sigma-70 family)
MMLEHGPGRLAPDKAGPGSSTAIRDGHGAALDTQPTGEPQGCRREVGAGTGKPASSGSGSVRRPDRHVLADLTVRCQQGDRQAWDQLVRTFQSVVWTVGRSFNLSQADVQDVGQVVWLRVVEHIGSVRQPELIDAWIVTTARREALRHLSRAAKYVPVDEKTFTDTSATHQENPEEKAILGDERLEVMAAFRQLPEKHQALLAMLMSEPPPSYDEISAALGIPRGSIGPTRARVLARTREILERDRQSRQAAQPGPARRVEIAGQ